MEIRSRCQENFIIIIKKLLNCLSRTNLYNKRKKHSTVAQFSTLLNDVLCKSTLIWTLHPQWSWKEKFFWNNWEGL